MSESGAQVHSTTLPPRINSVDGDTTPSQNALRRAEMQRAAELARASRPQREGSTAPETPTSPPAGDRCFIRAWELRCLPAARGFMWCALGCGIVGETDLRKVDIHPTSFRGEYASRSWKSYVTIRGRFPLMA